MYDSTNMVWLWALQELASAIENRSSGSPENHEEYAMVVGATCQSSRWQQPDGQPKSVVGQEKTMASTSTPSSSTKPPGNQPLDLFIPMSMASRRIILVGDDRQLPHAEPPDIEDSYRKSIN